MKAKVNGVEVEGTPEEIKRFMELTQEQLFFKPVNPPYDPVIPNPYKETIQPPWIITSGDKGTSVRPKVKRIVFGSPGVIYE